MRPEEIRVVEVAGRRPTGARLAVRSRRWLIVMSVVHAELTREGLNHYNQNASNLIAAKDYNAVLLISTETVPPNLLATARSGRPSALKSPTATKTEWIPVNKFGLPGCEKTERRSMALRSQMWFTLS